MARKRRTLIPDAIYHLVSRIANREFFLKDHGLKDKIVTWAHGISMFSGIEMLSYVVMDNHLHITVRVPSVPECYWNTGTGPSSTGTGPHPPASEAFGMRPPECNAPRWTPDRSDGETVITPAGDVLSEKAIVLSVSDGVPAVRLPRPPIGFDMPDDEVLERLRYLYSGWSNKAQDVKKHWESLRKLGKTDVIEAEKESYLRRMYNLPEFMKILKERISAYYKQHIDKEHSGTLWEGRFHSGIVDKEGQSRLFVSTYIAYNPVKAKIVSNAADFRWSSWSDAVNGSSPRSQYYRDVYSRLLGCEWEEAKSKMESIFAAKLPKTLQGKSEEEVLEMLKENELNCEKSSKTSKKTDADGVSDDADSIPLMALAVKLSLSTMRRGAYISLDVKFAAKVAARMPRLFGCPGSKCIERLRLVRRALKIFVA